MKGKLLLQILLLGITGTGLLSVFTGHHEPFSQVALALSPFYGGMTAAVAYGSVQNKKIQNGHSPAPNNDGANCIYPRLQLCYTNPVPR